MNDAPGLAVIRAQYDVSTERTDVERDVMALFRHIDAQAERLARAERNLEQTRELATALAGDAVGYARSGYEWKIAAHDARAEAAAQRGRVERLETALRKWADVGCFLREQLCDMAGPIEAMCIACARRAALAPPDPAS